MKSQILHFKYILLPLLIVSLYSQPKLSVDFGTGFYEPTMKGFDSNELVSFPTGNILTRNLLINFSTFYEFFHNLVLEATVVPLHKSIFVQNIYNVHL